MKTKYICYYDSLRYNGETFTDEIMKSLSEAEWEYQSMSGCFPANFSWPTSIDVLKVPIQGNLYDCGIFTYIMYGSYGVACTRTGSLPSFDPTFVWKKVRKRIVALLAAAAVTRKKIGTLPSIL